MKSDIAVAHRGDRFARDETGVRESCERRPNGAGKSAESTCGIPQARKRHARAAARVRRPALGVAVHLEGRAGHRQFEYVPRPGQKRIVCGGDDAGGYVAARVEFHHQQRAPRLQARQQLIE